MILKAPQLNWSLAYNYKGRFANLAGGMWRGEFCIREAWHCLREAGVLFQTFVHGGGHSPSLLTLSPICGAGRAKDFNRVATPPSLVKLSPTLHLWKLQQDLGNGPASKSPAPGKFGIRCAALGCVILAQNSSFPQAVRKLGKGKVKNDFWSSSSIFALFLAMHLTQASETIFR